MDINNKNPVSEHEKYSVATGSGLSLYFILQGLAGLTIYTTYIKYCKWKDTTQFIAQNFISVHKEI